MFSSWTLNFRFLFLTIFDKIIIKQFESYDSSEASSHYLALFSIFTRNQFILVQNNPLFMPPASSHNIQICFKSVENTFNARENWDFMEPVLLIAAAAISVISINIFLSCFHYVVPGTTPRVAVTRVIVRIRSNIIM